MNADDVFSLLELLNAPLTLTWAEVNLDRVSLIFCD